METIFDIATQAELADILGTSMYPGDVALYDTERKIAEEASDTGLAWLATLYSMRSNMTRANEYLASIKDDQYRLDTMLFINHP